MDRDEIKQVIKNEFAKWITLVMVMLFAVILLLTHLEICEKQSDHSNQNWNNPLPFLSQETTNRIKNIRD